MVVEVFSITPKTFSCGKLFTTITLPGDKALTVAGWDKVIP